MQRGWTKYSIACQSACSCASVLPMFCVKGILSASSPSLSLGDDSYSPLLLPTFSLYYLILSHLLPSPLLSQSLLYPRLEPALTLLRAWPPVQLLFMIALLTPSTFLLSRIHRFLFKFKGKKTKEDLITPDHRPLQCAVCLPQGG